MEIEKSSTKEQLIETSPSMEELQILEEPQERLSKWHIFLLNLSWYGLSLMFLVMSVEVVPSQIQALVGEGSKGRWLGGVVAGGAVLTFISSPLIGMTSDRITSKRGKRRPVMAVGTVFLSVGLLGMAFSAPEIRVSNDNGNLETMNGTGTCDVDLVAIRCLPYQNDSLPHALSVVPQTQDSGSVILPNMKPDNTKLSVNENGPKGHIALYVLFYLIVTTAFASVTVPYNALIADKSHPSQRGLNSGVMGAMILLGNVCGAGIGVSFMHIGVFCVYGVVIGVVLVCVTITLVTTPEAPGKGMTEPLSFKSIFLGFWQPLKEHDFRWVFITRFLMQQGVSTITAFLEYWLADVIYLPNCWTPQTSVALMLLPLLFAAAVCSIIFGVVTDRIGRRKPLVIISSLIMCVSACVLGLIRGHFAYYIAIVMAFIFGVGFGSYQAVDFALVMDVLPVERDKAKDLAVWHQALILPQALATPIGGLILDLFERLNCEIGLGYIILFMVTSLYFMLSGILVTRIRGVR